MSRPATARDPFSAFLLVAAVICERPKYILTRTILHFPASSSSGAVLPEAHLLPKGVREDGFDQIPRSLEKLHTKRYP